MKRELLLLESGVADVYHKLDLDAFSLQNGEIETIND